MVALNYLTQDQFTWSINNRTVDTLDPELYKLDTRDWNLLARVHSTNETLTENMNMYVGGVFMQESQGENGIPMRTFIEAVRCDQVRDNLSPELAPEMIEDHYCPNTD